MTKTWSKIRSNPVMFKLHFTRRKRQLLELMDAFTRHRRILKVSWKLGETPASSGPPLNLTGGDKQFSALLPPPTRRRNARKAPGHLRRLCLNSSRCCGHLRARVDPSRPREVRAEVGKASESCEAADRVGARCAYNGKVKDS